MTKHREIFLRLFAPFAEDEVRFREVGGRAAPYVTARTVANRLDAVLGPENWWDAYVPGPHSVLCTLTVRMPDGECVAKADAGGYAGMKDQGDDDMSGFSAAFKRAAARFGVGRYLYDDGVPCFEAEYPGGDAPVYPPIPLPQPNWKPDHRTDDRAPGFADRPAGPPPTGAPRTGRALFARIKDFESRGAEGLLSALNAWGKKHGLQNRMIDWTPADVEAAAGELDKQLEIRGIR